MLKRIKRTVPLELEGELNRTKAELAQAVGLGEPMPFVAERTYQAGEAISHAGRIYIANVAIIAGETVTPTGNATETNIESVINTLNAKEE